MVTITVPQGTSTKAKAGFMNIIYFIILGGSIQYVYLLVLFKGDPSFPFLCKSLSTLLIISTPIRKLNHAILQFFKVAVPPSS